MNMIEKVARAMMISQGYHATADTQWDDGDWFFQKFGTMAKAAIEAMREPTDEMMMISAPDMPAGGDIKDIWEAMIDEALKDLESQK